LKAKSDRLLAASAGYLIGAPSGIGIVINDNDNATPLTTTGIVFASHTSGATTRDVKLNVYRPSTGSGPWPVIIYFPGGGWVSQNEGSVPQLMTNFTASGYAIVSANYVTSSTAKWPAQIQDTKAAVRWVRANAATYGFDATKIGLTGSSSGGHMAAYTGLTGGLKTARVGSEVIDLVGNIGGNFTESDVVQAVAPIYPPTDLLVMDHYPTPDVPDHNGSGSPESGLIGFPIQTVPEKTGTANPMIHTRAGLPPFWITHGTSDRSVDFNQSERLHAALVNAGQPSTFWPVLGGGHGVGVIDSQDVITLLRVFFDRTLKGLTSNQLPVPTFTASTLSGPAPLTVNFDGSASTDPDGILTKYSWSTGDNSGGGNATLSYTYTRPGIYPASLSVRNEQGGISTLTANITVNPSGPAAGTAPDITTTSPTEGFLYARTGDLMFETTVGAGGNATGRSVTFFLDGEPIAFDNKSPWNTTLGSLPPGRYTAMARVSESNGDHRFSAPVTFQVIAKTGLPPKIPSMQNQFEFTYYRFADGTLTYTFERSENLRDWTPFTPTESPLTNGPQVQLMQAADPLATTGQPRRFLRIKQRSTP
jgi:acetyl esterase/lipase